MGSVNGAKRTESRDTRYGVNTALDYRSSAAVLDARPRPTAAYSD